MQQNSKWEVYSNKILPQEKRKILNKQHNLTPKATEKKEQTKQSYQKEIYNIEQSRITKKKQQKRPIKLKTLTLTLIKLYWFFEQINLIVLQQDSLRKNGRGLR